MKHQLLEWQKHQHIDKFIKSVTCVSSTICTHVLPILGCDCFTDGTVGGSNTCAKDSSGECPCKTFTTGRRCDECVDGYYGLSASNSGGCVDCRCDVGGAASSTCDKESGVCPCRTLVTGQRCDRSVYHWGIFGEGFFLGGGRGEGDVGWGRRGSDRREEKG